MQNYIYILGLFSMILISVASSDIEKKSSKMSYIEDTDPDKAIDKRQGGYSNNSPYSYQYNANPYQYDYKGYQNQYSNGVLTKNDDSAENKEGVDGAFTSDGLDRQDLFGGDMMSMVAAGTTKPSASAQSLPTLALPDIVDNGELQSYMGKNSFLGEEQFDEDVPAFLGDDTSKPPQMVRGQADLLSVPIPSLVAPPSSFPAPGAGTGFDDDLL